MSAGVFCWDTNTWVPFEICKEVMLRSQANTQWEQGLVSCRNKSSINYKQICLGYGQGQNDHNVLLFAIIESFHGIWLSRDSICECVFECVWGTVEWNGACSYNFVNQICDEEHSYCAPGTTWSRLLQLFCFITKESVLIKTEYCEASVQRSICACSSTVWGWVLFCQQNCSPTNTELWCTQPVSFANH